RVLLQAKPRRFTRDRRRVAARVSSPRPPRVRDNGGDGGGARGRGAVRHVRPSGVATRRDLYGRDFLGRRPRGLPLEARRGVDTAISVRAVGRGARCDGAARRPLLVLRRSVVVAPGGGARGGRAAVPPRVVAGGAAVDRAVAVDTGAAGPGAWLARGGAGRAARAQRRHRRHEALPSGRAAAPDGSGAPRTVCGAAKGQAGA